MGKCSDSYRFGKVWNVICLVPRGPSHAQRGFRILAELADTVQRPQAAVWVPLLGQNSARRDLDHSFLRQKRTLIATPSRDIRVNTRWVFECLCVPLVVTGILLNCFSRGCQGCTLDWHQRRRQCCICEINPGRRIDVPAWKKTYVMEKLFQSCVLQ